MARVEGSEIRRMEEAMVVAAERSYAGSLRKIMADAGVLAPILNYGIALLTAARGLDPHCLALLAPLATAKQVHAALCEVCSPPLRPTDLAAKILMPLCDVDRQSSRRMETALHRAAAMRASRCLRDLIEASNPELRDDENATALMKFAGRDFEALGMLAAKSSVFAVDHHGDTAIERMIASGRVEQARALFGAVGHWERGELLRIVGYSSRIRGARLNGQTVAELRAGLVAIMEAKILAEEVGPAARGPGPMRV